MSRLFFYMGSGLGSRLQPLDHLFGFGSAPDLAVSAVLLALFFNVAELIYELAKLFFTHEVGGEVLGHIAPLVAVALAGVKLPYGVELGASLTQASRHQAELARLDADMAVAYIYVGVLVICTIVMAYTGDTLIGTDRPLTADAIVLHIGGGKACKVDRLHFFVPLSLNFCTDYTTKMPGCQQVILHKIKKIKSSFVVHFDIV